MNKESQKSLLLGIAFAMLDKLSEHMSEREYLAFEEWQSHINQIYYSKKPEENIQPANNEAILHSQLEQIREKYERVLRMISKYTYTIVTDPALCLENFKIEAFAFLTDIGHK